MKTAAVFLLTVLFAGITAPVFAQNRQPPPALINQGFLAYSQNGLNDALQIWLQNSQLDRATLLKGELAALKYADAHYGAFESSEVMHTAALTSRITRVYLVLYYERAPLWAYFDLYRLRNGNQAISDVFFSPKVQVILPAELIAQ